MVRFGLAVAIAVIAGHSSAATPGCNVVADCGADPTNQTLSTDAVQRCIDRCKTGGTVTVPANSAFLITSLDFSGARNFVMEFGGNSTLHAVADPSLFPLVPFLPPVGGGTQLSWRPIFYAVGAENVTFRGTERWAAFGEFPATVNGNGWDWWANYSKGILKHSRPKLLEFVSSRGLFVEDLVFRNSPNWMLHPFDVVDVRFSRLRTLAPRAVGNTDGHHLSGTRNALIEDCLTDVGDDAFTATSYPWPNGTCVATNGVLITNTTMLSRNFGIGSQTFCGVHNVTMIGGRIGDDGGNAGGAGSSPWAVKIKQHPILGGTVSGILFDGVHFGKITPNSWQQSHGGWAATFYQTYAGSTPPPNNSPTNTTIKDVTFRNITVTSAIIPAQLIGERAGSISGITFDGFVIEDQSHTEPWSCQNVTDTVIQGSVSPLPAKGTCGT